MTDDLGKRSNNYIDDIELMDTGYSEENAKDMEMQEIDADNVVVSVSSAYSGLSGIRFKLRNKLTGSIKSRVSYSVLVQGVKNRISIKFRIIFACIACILCIVFIISFKELVSWHSEGVQAKNVQEEIRKEVKWVELPQTVLDEYTYLSIDFQSILERNSDVVAWIRVDNTLVDYPVVQATDNDYYVNNDIDKKFNKAGAIFADYRSNLTDLGFNTIIYGHNRSDNVMFGSLVNLLEQDFFSSDSAGYFNFNTLKHQMVFRICSVYITDYDDWYYFDVRFNSLEDKNDFIREIKKKNEIETFSTDDLSAGDTFITLSTCYGGVNTTKRLVVVGKLVGTK